jgi:hypothetical protein
MQVNGTDKKTLQDTFDPEPQKGAPKVQHSALKNTQLGSEKTIAIELLLNRIRTRTLLIWC